MYCFKTTVKLFVCGAMLVGLATGVNGSETKTVLVSSLNTDQVLMYDPDTGAYEGVFADGATLGTDSKGRQLLNDVTGVDIGPDGNVYVGYRDDLYNSSYGGIVKFSPTGAYLGEFYMGHGNISNIKFGPDGNLYFTRVGRPVERVLGPNSANPGTLDPTFLTPYGVEACEGLAFVDNGDGSYDYFVSMRDMATVERRHVSDSFTLVNTYTRPTTIGEGEDAYEDLTNYGLAIGPDGRLYLGTGKNIYVADLDDTEMTLFADGDDAATGGGLSTVLGMMFDDYGNIVVNSYWRDTVEKFSLADGTYQDQLVVPYTSPLVRPHYGLVVLDTSEPVQFPGDANRSGTVTELDAAILQENWLTQSGATWEMGDFNGDGKVNDIDATMMAANWYKSAPAPSQAAVPEPSTLMLLAGGLLCLLVWRRR